MHCSFIEEVMMFPPRFSMTRTVIVMLTLLAPGCSGDSSRPIPDNDVPAIASLDPDYAAEGQGGFTMDVHGQGFNLDSVVRWNGADRSTLLSNPTPGVFVLRASIPSSDVAAVTTAQITVFNPPPGGGLSNSVAFGVFDPSDINPVPHIFNVAPSFASTGSPETFTVTGTGFVNDSVVIWTPHMATTGFVETSVTFVNAGELTVVIPAQHITPIGNATVEVRNPSPGGGTSNSDTVNVL